MSLKKELCPTPFQTVRILELPIDFPLLKANPAFKKQIVLYVRSAFFTFCLKIQTKKVP